MAWKRGTLPASPNRARSMYSARSSVNGYNLREGLRAAIGGRAEAAQLKIGLQMTLWRLAAVRKVHLVRAMAFHQGEPVIRRPPIPGDRLSCFT
jgi:hypothetical protein